MDCVLMVKEEVFAKEKDLKNVASFLTSLITVDQGIGYSIDSFAVREKASPLLREKANKLRLELGLPVDDRLPGMVQHWLVAKNEDEKNKMWTEIEKFLNEALK